MKLGYLTAVGQTRAQGYKAQVQSASDYFPFGWTMPSRQFNSSNYRYGFNGKENDHHWAGQLIQDYGFRLYNPAIAKFLSVDPLAPDFPELTVYQFASNSPILHIDLDGLEAVIWHVGRDWDGTKIKVTEYDRIESTVGGRIDIVNGPDGNYRIVPDDFDGSLLNVDDNTINSWVNGNDAKDWFDGVNNITDFGDLVGNIMALGSFVTSGLTQKVTKSTKTGRGTGKTNTSAAEDAIWQKYKQESSTVTVYHKGKLNNGKVGSDKSLSTGKNKESVSALDREGDVHQFDIPKNVYDDWLKQGKAKTLKDLDKKTGVYNEEVRFSGNVSEDLNKYKKGS